MMVDGNQMDHKGFVTAQQFIFILKKGLGVDAHVRQGKYDAVLPDQSYTQAFSLYNL